MKVVGFRVSGKLLDSLTRYGGAHWMSVCLLRCDGITRLVDEIFLQKDASQLALLSGVFCFLLFVSWGKPGQEAGFSARVGSCRIVIIALPLHSKSAPCFAFPTFDYSQSHIDVMLLWRR